MIHLLYWLHDGVRMSNKKSPFGDWNAAERSVELLQNIGYC